MLTSGAKSFFRMLEGPLFFFFFNSNNIFFAINPLL